MPEFVSTCPALPEPSSLVLWKATAHEAEYRECSWCAPYKYHPRTFLTRDELILTSRRRIASLIWSMLVYELNNQLVKNGTAIRGRYRNGTWKEIVLWSLHGPSPPSLRVPLVSTMYALNVVCWYTLALPDPNSNSDESSQRGRTKTNRARIANIRRKKCDKEFYTSLMISSRDMIAVLSGASWWCWWWPIDMVFSSRSGCRVPHPARASQFKIAPDSHPRR